jgi:predicted metal-binding protein
MSKKAKPRAGTIIAIPTGWRDTIFVCRKCSKKLDGGFGPDGRQSLRGMLRDGLRQRGQRGAIGLLEVGCLGLCPKEAVTMGLASTPGEFLVVGKGASANAVFATLTPSRSLDEVPRG